MRSCIVYDTTWGDNPDHASGLEQLTLAVNRWLQEGWTPHSGVVIQERA